MMKEKLYEIIDRIQLELTAFSDAIWEYAELSMQEHRSAKSYCRILRDYGFTVEEDLCGIQTAFLGRYGSGRPVIGILGEFDALAGLSQKADSLCRETDTPGGNGHGCGHNLLGAASLGAAVAVKELLAQGTLQGTVVFYGCPGEEGCAGKVFMARDGMFRDLDAALCWHPSDVNEVTTGSNAASMQVSFTFTGRASHAANAPEHGRSALDAAELMNIGVQYLREHMPKNGAVHYAYLDAGGISPNVVQPVSKLLYMVRGETVEEARNLLKRVEKIAQGAALMTETTVSWEQIDGTASTLSNHILEEKLFENLKAAPLPTYDQEDWEYAAAVKQTYKTSSLPGQRTQVAPDLRMLVADKTQMGRRALNDFILPYGPSDVLNPGSTDVGDVSWLTPTAQFTAVTWPSGCPAHSWQAVALGKNAIAHKGMLYAAKVLAGTVFDLMTDPEVLEKARKEFDIFASSGYDCPISPDLKPY